MSSVLSTHQLAWQALLGALALVFHVLRVAQGPSLTAGAWYGPRPSPRPQAPRDLPPLARQKGWKGFFPFGLSVCMRACGFNSLSSFFFSVCFWRWKVTPDWWIHSLVFIGLNIYSFNLQKITQSLVFPGDNTQPCLVKYKHLKFTENNSFHC